MIVVSSVPELPPVITPEGELVGASHEYVVPAGIVPSVGVIDITEPVHTSCSMLSIDGSGFTVIVNVCGVPSHPSKLGVTVTVDVIASLVVLVAVTFILPEPELDSPIAELVLVHEYVVSPPVLSVMKLILILSLLQNSWSSGLSTCPKGLTVTETVNGSPVQPSGVVGVTV